MKIDFNSDLAEGVGVESLIMPHISSANICCGLHAGGYDHIYKTLLLAKEHNVRVGAHPGFDDRANFGRTNMNLSENEIDALLSYQFGALEKICDLVGVKIEYVKPHGALYNMACVDINLARCIAKNVKKLGVALMGLSNSCLIKAANELNIPSISEVFADRRYTDDGLLVSRGKENALIKDENEAIEQVISMVKNSFVISENGKKVDINAQSLCIHGDGEKAIEFAKKIREKLQTENIQIRS